MLSILDDFETMELFRQGLTENITNFKGETNQKLLTELNPISITDLCNIYSLNREIAKDNLSKYIANKSNQKNIKYVHPILKKLSKETFGVILYNEQIMHVIQNVANISSIESNLIRKALGKKSTEELKLYFEKFKNGALKNTSFLNECIEIQKDKNVCINEIWNLIGEKIFETISFAFVLQEVSKSYFEALEISRNKKTIR